MSLQALLNAIQHHDYVVPAAELRQVLSAATLAAAEQAGIVYVARPATYLACACGGRRAIVESEGTAHPYVAVCEDSTDCLDRPLTDEDLEQRGVSVEGATDALASLLQLAHGGAMAGDRAPGVVRLGMRDHQGVLTEVFLLVRAAPAVVREFATARGVAPFATLLLATTTDTLPHDLLGRHGPGQRVEIAPLTRFLELRNERIVARVAPTPAAALAPAVRHVGAAPFCVLMTQEGERALSRPEYDALLVSEAAEFGIFLDAAVLRGKRRGAGGFEVLRRTKPGASAASSLLTSSEAAIVTEFLRKGRGGFVDVVEQLDALDRMADAERAFRNAWQKFDPERQLLMKRASRNDTFARVRPSTDVAWGVLVPVE